MLVLILHISLLTFSMITYFQWISRNFLVPTMRLSCYEEEVAALQPHTIDIRNKPPFFFLEFYLFKF